MFRAATILMAALLLTGGGADRLFAGSNSSVNRAALSGLSDAQIERDIRARLARSPKISLDKFTVKVQGGVATFEGKTNVIQHKGVATRMAKAAGAKMVVNNIQISDAARKQAGERLAEGRKKAAVVKAGSASSGSPIPSSSTGTTVASGH